MTTSHVTLPDPTQRPIALCVIDEALWSALVRTVDIPLDAFTAPRIHFAHSRQEPKRTLAGGATSTSCGPRARWRGSSSKAAT